MLQRLIVLLSIFMMTACNSAAPASTLERTPTSGSTSPPMVASPTPDPCTGWTCEIHGVVYNVAVQPGNEVDGISLTLLQSSHCSPTRGEHATQSDALGAFTFGQLFFHDTDRVQIRIDLEDTASIVWDSQGRYCYYCSCFSEPLEIVLPPTTDIQ